jgi:hypothetical protein
MARTSVDWEDLTDPFIFLLIPAGLFIIIDLRFHVEETPYFSRLKVLVRRRDARHIAKSLTISDLRLFVDDIVIVE